MESGGSSGRESPGGERTGAERAQQRPAQENATDAQRDGRTQGEPGPGTAQGGQDEGASDGRLVAEGGPRHTAATRAADTRSPSGAGSDADRIRRGQTDPTQTRFGPNPFHRASPSTNRPGETQATPRSEGASRSEPSRSLATERGEPSVRAEGRRSNTAQHGKSERSRPARPAATGGYPGQRVPAPPWPTTPSGGTGPSMPSCVGSLPRTTPCYANAGANATRKVIFSSQRRRTLVACRTNSWVKRNGR